MCVCATVILFVSKSCCVLQREDVSWSEGSWYRCNSCSRLGCWVSCAVGSGLSSLILCFCGILSLGCSRLVVSTSTSDELERLIAKRPVICWLGYYPHLLLITHSLTLLSLPGIKLTPANVNRQDYDYIFVTHLMAIFHNKLAKLVPEFRILLELRMMEVVVQTFKALVKSLPLTNQYPTYYRPDALPVAQPTVSKHWRGTSVIFHRHPWLELVWGGVSSNLVFDHERLQVTLGGTFAKPLVSRLTLVLQ